MNVVHPIADKIMKRFQACPGDSVVSTADLLKLGARAAVDQALSRLVRQGRIRRIRRGLYQVPRMGKLLNRPLAPSPHKLAQAWARKNGLRLVPSGAYAANLLGLSTQVPAKITYYTNGRTRTLKLGPYTIRLLNRGPKTMDVKGQIGPLVLQAFRYMGKNGVTPEALSRLRLQLRPKDIAELKSALPFASAWIRLALRPIIESRTKQWTQ